MAKVLPASLHPAVFAVLARVWAGVASATGIIDISMACRRNSNPLRLRQPSPSPIHRHRSTARQTRTTTRLAIAGYRSLRDIRVSLAALNVVTGANGSGKSSLYRALRLLADIAQGRIIQSLAGEGGLHSTLWAGPELFPTP